MRTLLGLLSILVAAYGIAQEKPNELGKYGVDPKYVKDGAYRGRFAPDADYVLSGQLRKDIGPLPDWGWKYLAEKDGYNPKAFSAPPEPGVHPRVLMSPEDIVAIREKIKDKDDRYTQAVWENIKNAAARDVQRWRPHYTDTMIDHFLVALVTEDDELGRKTADLFMKEVDYFSCVIDILNSSPEADGFRDSWYYFSRKRVAKVGGIPFEEAYRKGGSKLVRELAKKSTTLGAEWSGAGASAYLFNCPLSNYDYAYKYLSEEERDVARKAIAAATYGRYTAGMGIAGNMFINNHQSMGEDLLLLALSIEGEEGYDPRLLKEYSIAVRNKLTYDISPAGNLHEKCKGFLPERATIAITKRGEYPLMSLDRIKALAMSKAMDANFRMGPLGVHMSPPTVTMPYDEKKRVWAMGAGSGPWMDQFFNWAFVIKHAYPNDPIIDFFYKNRVRPYLGPLKGPLDPEEKLWRIGYTHRDLMILCSTMGLKNNKGEVIDYNELGCPPKELTERSPLYADNLRGVAVSRSSWDKDATKLTFECRSDALSAGHESPEANDFYLYANGVVWSSRNLWYADCYFRNMILVDGWAGIYCPVAGKMLLAQKDATGTTFVGDATDQYNWRKHEKNFYSWHNLIWEHPAEGRAYGGGRWGRDWEVPFQKQMREYHEGYAGLDWGNWHGETRGPEMFQRWNHIDHFFRTIHLSEGEVPYVLVVDDIRKDDKKHSYDWCMTLNENIVPYEASSSVGINQNARRMPDERWTDLHFTIEEVLDNGRKPEQGDPMLLVRVLWREAERMFPQPAYEKGYGPARVIIPALAVEPEYRVLLYPYRFGDKMPLTQWNADRSKLTIKAGDTTDVYTFGKTDRGRTIFQKTRNGQVAGGSQAGPAAPVLALKTGYAEDRNKLDPIRELVFGNEALVSFDDPALDKEIRYTLDGSEPTGQSTLYAGPIRVTGPGILKARTFATFWPFQEDNGSKTTQLKLVQRTAASSVSAPKAAGLRCDAYEVFMTIFDDETGIFTGKKETIPDFKESQLLSSVRVPAVSIPPVVPQAPAIDMCSGYYKYTGFFNASADGEYHFKLNSCGPVHFEIGGQNVISMRGVYGNSQKDRFGTAVLKKGWHPLSLVICDPVLWKNGAGEGLYKVSLNMMAPGQDAYQGIPESLFGCNDAEIATVPEPVIPAPQAVALPAGVQPGLVLKKYMREEYTQASKNGLTLEQIDPAKPGDHYWSGHASDLAASYAPISMHVFSGYIKIVKGGVYTFSTDPNGVNRLWIGGEEVCRNKVQAPRLTGKVRLNPGYYSFRLMACGAGFLGHRQGDNLAAIKGLLEITQPGGKDSVAAPIGMFAAKPVKPFSDPTPMLAVKPVMDKDGVLSIAGRSRNAEARIFGGHVIQGRKGKALKLNGKGSRLSLNNMPALEDATSVSYWLRVDTFGRVNMMNSYGKAEAGIRGTMLEASIYKGSDKARFDLNKLPGFKAGQWIHVTMTYGDTICLYVNGVKRAETPRTGSSAKTPRTVLFNGLDGAVEDLKLFNKVLSAEEVKKLASTDEP